LRKENLQNQFAEFEKFQQAEIAGYEATLNNASEMTKRVNDRMQAYLSGSSSTLYQELLNWNKQYGTGMDSDIISKWEKAIGLVQQYNQTLQGISGGGGFQFENYTGNSDRDKTLAEMRANRNAWNKKTDEKEKKRLNDKNIQLAKKIGYSFNSKDGNYYSDKDGSRLIFDNGGRFEEGDVAVKKNSTPEWILRDDQFNTVIQKALGDFMSMKMPQLNGNNGKVEINVNVDATNNTNANEIATKTGDRLKDLVESWGSKGIRPPVNGRG
jgi:hypothetical protein